MSRWVYLLTYFTLAASLVMLFFDRLPDNPFLTVINDLITFLESDTVEQGLSWLAWFFPTTNVLNLLPAFLNALIAFFTFRGTLFLLSLHA